MHVSELMEKAGKVVTTSDDVQRALEIMHAEGVSMLPVVEENGRVVGVIRESRIREAGPTARSTSDNLDEALEETFPASDPIAPAQAPEPKT